MSSVTTTFSAEWLSARRAGLRGFTVALLVAMAGPFAVAQETPVPEDLAEIVRDLGSPSFEVRSIAQERLDSLDAARLGDLRRAKEATSDAEIQERLDLAIERIQVELARRNGLRGEAFSHLSFGPFGPGRVTVHLYAPHKASGVVGVHCVLLFANEGEGRVGIGHQSIDVAALPAASFQSHVRQDRSRGPVMCGNGIDYWWQDRLVVEDFALAPGETRVFTFYLNAGFGSFRFGDDKQVEIGVRLSTRLVRGMRKGRLFVDWEPRTTIELDPATDGEAAVAQEIVELGMRDLTQGEKQRLRYLLATEARPQERLSPSAIQTLYEHAAGRDVELARIWLGVIYSTRPQEEAIEYATSRIRSGDPTPLPGLALDMPRDAVPAIFPFLDAKSPDVRSEAIQALTWIEEPRPSERVAQLLADPDEWVRLVALRYVGALRVPCGDKIAPLLKEWEGDRFCELLNTLVAIGARDQVPAIVEQLPRNRVFASSILRAVGKLGGPADIVRGYLDSKNSFERAAAVDALGDLGLAEEADRIAGILESPGENHMVKTAAIRALGKLHSEKHVALLIRLAKDDSSFRLVWTCEALGEIGTPEAVARLLDIARGLHAPAQMSWDKETIRSVALREAARSLPADRAVPELAGILADTGVLRRVREAALRGLAPHGPAGAREIQKALDDPALSVAAMWELSRYSAPTLVERPLRVPWPYVGERTVGNFLGHLRAAGIEVTVEDLGTIEETHIRPREWPLVSLEDLLNDTCGLGEGFILVDRQVRVVPRARAVEFYRSLLLADAPDRR